MPEVHYTGYIPRCLNSSIWSYGEGVTDRGNRPNEKDNIS